MTDRALANSIRLCSHAEDEDWALLMTVMRLVAESEHFSFQNHQFLPFSETSPPISTLFQPWLQVLLRFSDTLKVIGRSQHGVN